MSPATLQRLPVQEQRLIRRSQALIRGLDIKLSPAILARLEYAVPGTAPLIRRKGRVKVRTAKNPEMVIAWAIGRRVLAAREKRGWTQQDLTDRSGIARANIARLEAGRHAPKLDTLRRIALALALKVPDLLKAPTNRPGAEDRQWIESGASGWSAALEQEDRGS